MYRIASWLTVLFLFVRLPLAGLQAHSPDERDEVERSVRTALEEEQAAFQSGDCERAMSFVGDRTPLFVVSGRVIPTKSALTAMCGRLAGPRPGADRTLEGHVVHVLSPVAAYSVTTYAVATEGANGEQATSSQIVTKIWESIDGTWRIVHFHESAR